jgi:large subunit ribosomal protein L18
MIKNRLKRRHYHIRKKISGDAVKPRLCVKRSNKNIYAILIDDVKHKVIATISSLNKGLNQEKPAPEKKKAELKGKSLLAYQVGYSVAEKAKSLGVSKVVFDRAGYRYHGRLKALAEGARKGGLKF